MNVISNEIRWFKKICRAVTALDRGKGFLFMIGLSLMSMGVFIPQSAWSLDPALREAFIASLPRGETFENDGSTYVLLPTLRAEKTDGRKAESGMNANAGSALTDTTMEAVVERKGLFSVYRQSLTEEPSIHTVSKSTGEALAHPVVLNLETKSLGIITGNLWLKLKDMQDARPIADSYGMPLSFVNIPMSTSFYEIPAEVNILMLRKRLESDSRILRVTVDMVDRINLPQ